MNATTQDSGLSQAQYAGLAAPFHAQDLEWRVGRSGVKDGKPWASVLAYVTSRAIMDRLDSVVGCNWGNEIKVVQLEQKSNELTDCRTHCGFMCGITIGNVTKWDAADCTDIEFIKGGVSGAMKRAAVHWGIGRYLYRLGDGWAEFNPSGQYSAKVNGEWFKWSPPALPEWAIPATQAGAEPKPATVPATAIPRAETSAPKTIAKPAEVDANWKSFIMPQITKLCAGKIISECMVDSQLQGTLRWWANNYKVQPGKYAEKNQLFRDALDAYLLHCEAESEQDAPNDIPAEQKEGY